MPSPFPGMDPYIEDAKIWPDFHNNLATEIQGQLNRVIQPRYVARLVPYVTYETIQITDVRGVRPDVGIWHIPAREGVVEATLCERLPVLPVPLLEPDPDVALDLGAAVAAVYERGGYASLIDYHQPPPPPNLTDAEARWLDDFLRQRGLR